MRNPQVQATAGKKARAKLVKIQELGITADMSEDDADALIVRLATAKAIEDSVPVADKMKGQQWYVNELIKFAGMTALERLNTEYDDCFFEVASEEEILAMLEDPAPVPVVEKPKTRARKKAA